MITPPPQVVQRNRSSPTSRTAGSFSSAGRNAAKWNGRDVINPPDLPITKGLQERMREFDKFEEAEEIRRLLAQNLRRPPSDVTFAEDTPVSIAIPPRSDAGLPSRSVSSATSARR